MNRRFEQAGRAGGIERRGMTLTELMISLAIFGIILGVVFGFLTGARNSYSETRAKAQYQQSMRAVISLLSREVRSTGCRNPLNPAFERILVADVDRFRCRMDLNGDGDTADTSPDEDVTYVFNAGTGELSRIAGADNMVILRDMTNLTFTYFDAAGNALNNVPLSALDRARVSAVAIGFEGEARHAPVEYATRIMLRNE